MTFIIWKMENKLKKQTSYSILKSGEEDESHKQENS